MPIRNEENSNSVHTIGLSHMHQGHFQENVSLPSTTIHFNCGSLQQLLLIASLSNSNYYDIGKLYIQVTNNFEGQILYTDDDEKITFETLEFPSDKNQQEYTRENDRPILDCANTHIYENKYNNIGQNIFYLSQDIAILFIIIILCR